MNPLCGGLRSAEGEREPNFHRNVSHGPGDTKFSFILLLLLFLFLSHTLSLPFLLSLINPPFSSFSCFYLFLPLPLHRPSLSPFPLFLPLSAAHMLDSLSLKDWSLVFLLLSALQSWQRHRFITSCGAEQHIAHHCQPLPRSQSEPPATAEHGCSARHMGW